MSTGKEMLPNVLNAYLRRLRWSLSELPSEERQEIIEETRSYLQDLLGDASAVTPEQALRELGRPEDYAQALLESHRISVALASGSAVMMLRQSAKLVGQRVAAFFGFLVLATLYSLVLGLTILAVLKPILPESIGLWRAHDGSALFFGFLDSASRPHYTDLLGYWLIPVCLAIASILYLGTTRLLRRFLGSLRRQVEKTPP